MEPNYREVALSQVLTLLDELYHDPFNKTHFEGYHPDVYSRVVSKETGDRWVAKLCAKLQTVDVTKYSLELQMWWRDHQQADADRLREELKSKRTDEARKRALAKLTPYERRLLNL
jgi:hypothetical protein